MAESPAGQIPSPFILVIFGATGDLTSRKLIPAIYSLFRRQLLPDKFMVIGFARRDNTDQGFREQMCQAIETYSPDLAGDTQAWHAFASRLFYHQASFDDDSGFQSLRHRLDELAVDKKIVRNYLFYLACQPAQFSLIANQLQRAGLHREDPPCQSWSRLIIEKPFGWDLSSARRLDADISAVFREKQIFRIDHYLGKETVQNLLVLRFANSIFEPLWNQHYIDHVQISVCETVGVQNRGPYYEQAGALRDIVQNHLMHLLSLVAMEPPFSLEPNAIRSEKVQVLKSLRPIPAECVRSNVVRAQYSSGTIRGREVCGYRQEERVASDSNTETFVAFKAMIDNWRWAGVPFYLRTGKRMPARITEIGIHFKHVPRVLFSALSEIETNWLSIRIQPNEGISLRFQVKAPGPAMQVKPLEMDFSYAAAFGQEPPEAYERLLLDAALGDQTLFIRNDEVEAAWSFIQPILECYDQQKEKPLPMYAAGTWGPRQGDDLITADGRKWQLMKRSSHKK